MLLVAIGIVHGPTSAEKFGALVGSAALVFLGCQELFVRQPNKYTAALYGGQLGLVAGLIGFVNTFLGRTQAGTPFDVLGEALVWSSLAMPLFLLGGVSAAKAFANKSLSSQK